VNSPPPDLQAPPAHWRQPGVGAGWQQRFINRFIRKFGKRPAYFICYLVTFWYVLFYPSIRKRTQFYLRRRFIDHRGFPRRFLDSYRLVRTFGTTLVDMAAFGILGEKSLAVSSPTHDEFLRLCSDKRGYVLLNAHVGCWQVAMSALGEYHKPVAVVMIPEPRTVAMMDASVKRIIDPRSGLASIVEMTEVLLGGYILGMMGDRVFGDRQNIVEVSFLGDPAAMAVTPYRLASATGLPVVVMIAPKTGFSSYDIRIAKVIEVPPNLGRDAKSYSPYAQQFAMALEEFVQKYPWQFYNFYDIWNDGREELSV